MHRRTANPKRPAGQPSDFALAELLPGKVHEGHLDGLALDAVHEAVGGGGEHEEGQHEPVDHRVAGAARQSLRNG